MNILSFWTHHKMIATSYVPHPESFGSSSLMPAVPILNMAERFLLLALFIFLIWPLLRAHADRKLESERVRTLFLSGIVVTLLVMIKLYQTIAGT